MNTFEIVSKIKEGAPEKIDLDSYNTVDELIEILGVKTMEILNEENRPIFLEKLAHITANTWWVFVLILPAEEVACMIEELEKINEETFDDGILKLTPTQGGNFFQELRDNVGGIDSGLWDDLKKELIVKKAEGIIVNAVKVIRRLGAEASQ